MYLIFETDEAVSGRLQKAIVDIQSNQKCDEIYESNNIENGFKHGFNSALSICAGDPVDGKDTCEVIH